MVVIRIIFRVLYLLYSVQMEENTSAAVRSLSGNNITSHITFQTNVPGLPHRQTSPQIKNGFIFHSQESIKIKDLFKKPIISVLILFVIAILSFT